MIRREHTGEDMFPFTGCSASGGGSAILQDEV